MPCGNGTTWWLNHRAFNPKTETDLEQKQTPTRREQAEPTERRLEPEIFAATRRVKTE